MLKILCAAVLTVASMSALATGVATVTCGSAAPGVQHNGMAPMVQVRYSPDADTGSPGLLFLGLLSPDQTQGAVLSLKGWSSYSGGLYPPQARYDAGLPGVIPISVGFPDGPGVLSTAGMAGFVLYVGHGAYTPDGQKQVANRRALLESVRAQRVAAGTWQAAYDSDDQMIWSLVQKDMTKNNKFVALLTVPSIDCAPLQNQN